MAGVPFNPLASAAPEPAKLQPVQADPAVRARFLEQKAAAPNAASMSDAQFALAAHQHYYSDVPVADYLTKLGFDRGDVLYELRAPGDQYGDYLRQALATPATGETEEQAAVRQGGQLDERRAGDVEGVARAALQGSTFGFGDEIVAAGAAALDPLVHGDRGKDFNERFNAYQGRESGLVENFREDNPVAAYGAEIAGAIPTGVAAGGQLVGRGASALQRTLTGMGVGAGQGAVYGAGATDGDLQDRANGAVTGALVGGATSAGLSTLQGALNSILKAASKGQVVKEAVEAAPTADQIKGTSQAAYRAADDSGVSIRPEATSLLRQDFDQFLTTEGLMLDGKIVGGFGKVRKAAKMLENFADRPMTMRQFQRLEESFQDIAASPKAGEARIGTMLLQKLDDHVESLPQQAYEGGNGPEAATNWLKGKQEWAHHKRTKSLEDAIYSARLSGNFAEGLKGEIRTILKSDKKRRGFSPGEIEAMEGFVLGSPIGSLMKVLSEGGGLPGAAWGTLAGGPVGTVAGVAIPAAAKAGINAGARNTGNRIRAEVASGGLPTQGLDNLIDLQRYIPGATNPAQDNQRSYLNELMFGGR